MDISEEVLRRVLEREERFQNAKPGDIIKIGTRINMREYIEKAQEDAQEDKTIKTV